MKITIIFDDVLIADPALHDLFGVVHFGALMFQRRKRCDAMAEIARAANADFMHLQSPKDRETLIDELLSGNLEDGLFLHMPAHLAATGASEHLTTALKQIAYTPSPLYLPASTQSRQGWSLIPGSRLRDLMQKAMTDPLDEVFESFGHDLAEVRNRIKLVDLRDERTLLNYLSGQMDARHFNSVLRDDYTITKRSTDRVKLKQEFDFHQAVPPQMQMFLVPPFDFEDDGETASYRMERLSIPDMAMQWVHGAFQAHEFDRFLQHILYFMQNRPEKSVDQDTAVAVQDALYIDKVRTRIADLKALEPYTDLEPYFERAFGGIDALVERYEALFAKMRSQLPASRLVIGHGDPCFSNILYSKTNQYLKLIDPRGASSEADLYTDPIYDIAKLSHSVLGRYDFINQGDFDITVSAEMKPELKFDQPELDWVTPLFTERLQSAGHDLPIVRLCEASLFISMLPLHIDKPKNVLGFALRGHAILNELTKTKR